MAISVKKKVLYTVTIVIGFLVLFFAVGELSLRLYIHFRYGVPGKSYGIYMIDKELGAIHRPNSYNTNSVINNWGFRNIEDISEHKPEGALRIYCSGGSTTFCYNLRTEEAWSSLLQDKLRRMPGHERDEVLNAGEICFATSHEFALAKRFIPRLGPDIVILYGSGINEDLAAFELKEWEKQDFDKLLKEKKWGVFPRKTDQARFLKRNSTLVKFYDYVLKTWLAEHLTKIYRSQVDFQKFIHPWVIANFDHTLQDYIRFLKNYGCKVIFVRYADNGDKELYLTDCIGIFRERAAKIAQDEGIVVYDFLSIVEQNPHRKNLFDTTVHLSREGAGLLADGLLKVILEHINNK